MTSSMTYDVVAVYSSDLVADLAFTPITFDDLVNRKLVIVQLRTPRSKGQVQDNACQLISRMLMHCVII